MTLRQFLDRRPGIFRQPVALLLLATAILAPATAHAEAFSDAAGRGAVSAFLFASIP
jgi:hypothetical protein